MVDRECRGLNRQEPPLPETAVAVYQVSLKSSFGIEELFSNLQEKYHCFRTEKDV